MVTTQQHIGTDESYYEGDALEIVVTLDNLPDQGLTGATVSWTMAEEEGKPPILSDSDTGVSVSITDASNGVITVTIGGGITDDLVGTYEHEMRITDSLGRPAVVTKGYVQISERVTP